MKTNSPPSPSTIPSSLQQQAKLAGFLCLFFSIGSVLHYSLIDVKLFLPDDPNEVLQFIQEHKTLFYLGILGDVLLFIAVLAMAF
ncbi:MAG: DUF4386 family protein, partial [Bacteroidota bacterium]